MPGIVGASLGRCFFISEWVTLGVACGEHSARPWHNGEEREARVGPPTWAEFVESLDFRWLNCPSDTLGGGDDENELVNVKDGSMAVERFASRQPNPQRMSRGSGVGEVVGQRDVGRPCQASHGEIESADAAKGSRVSCGRPGSQLAPDFRGPAVSRIPSA